MFWSFPLLITFAHCIYKTNIIFFLVTSFNDNIISNRWNWKLVFCIMKIFNEYIFPLSLFDHLFFMFNAEVILWSNFYDLFNDIGSTCFNYFQLNTIILFDGGGLVMPYHSIIVLMWFVFWQVSVFINYLVPSTKLPIR